MERDKQETRVRDEQSKFFRIACTPEESAGYEANSTHLAKFAVQANIPELDENELTPAFGQLLYEKFVCCHREL